MNRPMMVVVATMMLLFAPFSLAQAPAPAGDRPDPNYEAKVGDRSVVVSEGKDGKLSSAWAASTESDYKAYARALKIKDVDEAKEMILDKKIIKLDPRTPILVAELRDVVHRDLDVEDSGYKSHMAAVRVLDGPMKGKKLYLHAWSVTRMIPKK